MTRLRRKASLTAAWLQMCLAAAPLAAQNSPTCTLSAQPRVTLSDAMGAEFGRIADAAFVHDTIIAVGDAMARNVTFFSWSGRRLAQHGRAGEGPGEFRVVQRVTALADTVVVVDPSLQRLSLFTLERGFLRSSRTATGVRALLPGGRVLRAVSPGGRNVGAGGPELWPGTLDVQIEDAHGGVRNVTRLDDRVRIASLVNGFSIVDAPYTRIPQIDANEREIVTADASGEIRRHPIEGGRAATVRAPFERDRVSQADVNGWIEQEVARSRPDRHAAVRKLYVVARPPAAAPAHGALALDHASTIWLQQYRAPHDTRAAGLVAFDREQRTVLRTTTAAQLRLLAASPRAVAFATRGELDTDIVVIHAVRCGGS